MDIGYSVMFLNPMVVHRLQWRDAGSEMADYPRNEIVDMILILGESQNDYRGAARLYAERYPDRRYPDDRAIRRLTRRARGGHMVLQHLAYHITLVQELQFEHFQHRIVFCHWALQMIEHDPDFFNFVLFSDEAKIQSDGKLNRHN
ncbi:hypothetical protein TSAR_007700 [Trichomalopsis sarcophagae]|uniref:DUF4817 domain-containing protein n=1 Tax=Trichomalopsis sarcophagae TaxID=543379 RepID=A0A232EUX1_9HYME|nr:hypothetical protein TSAR_007700 [Trichomalopsis sarcophagae]